MKMELSLGGFASICVVILSHSSSLFANTFQELSPEDQAKVASGQMVTIYTDVTGAPWPKMKVYQRIDATPEEVMAVFSDYPLQSTYVPYVKVAKISQVIDKSTALVDYTYNLPMGFGIENYTVRDHIEAYDEGKSFTVNWVLVKADTTKRSEGEVRCEPLAGGGTLYTYDSFIWPNRWGTDLKWVIERAKQAVLDTVTATAKQIQTEKTSSPEILQKQIQDLHNAVS